MADIDQRQVIPDTMRAIGFAAPGGPDVLTLETARVPEIGENDVLIRVAYAGVNRPDCLQRAGAYPPPPDASTASVWFPATAILRRW